MDSAGSRSEPVEAGDVVDNCRIETLLGSGAFGAVYKAMHLGLEQPRALKFLIPRGGDLAGVKTRFLNEARHTAKLSHPNIVIVHNVGEHRGLPFINMEYLPGASLRSWIQRGGVGLRGALRVVDQVLAALASAHGKGVIHRDVKPDNTMLLEDGIAKVVDFGLSLNVVGVAAQARVTLDARAPMGTPLYMAPEQWQSSSVGPPADVWSVGVMLYELLAGHVPFGGSSLIELMDNVTRNHHVPLHHLVPTVPDKLSALVDRMLAKKAERRPEDAAEARAQLHAAVGAPSDPRLSHASAKDVLAETIADGGLPDGFERQDADGASSIVRVLRKLDASPMLLMPGGQFLMGAANGDADERPMHKVELSPFLLDEHPVTRRQYATFLTMWGSDLDDAGNKLLDADVAGIDRFGQSWEPSGGDDEAVTGVTWWGAVAYAKWAGVELPTEAQLEYAMDLAGDPDDDIADALARLVGVVRLLCADSYHESAYRVLPLKNPILADESLRFVVVRGLSKMMSPLAWVRTRREFAARHDVALDVGFRCALPLAKNQEPEGIARRGGRMGN